MGADEGDGVALALRACPLGVVEEVAEGRVVDDLRWLCDRATDATGSLLAETRGPAIRVLNDCARVLSTPRAAGRDRYRADLADAAMVETRERMREAVKARAHKSAEADLAGAGAAGAAGATAAE